MTILAITPDYLAEYEAGILTIARYSDGQAVALTGKGIAGEFRACLKTHAPERVCATFVRMAVDAHKRAVARPGYRSPLGSLDQRDGDGWAPLYMPEAMPRTPENGGWAVVA